MSNSPDMASAGAAVPEESAGRWNWEKFPPWLMSLVGHLSLVIVLALVVNQAMTPQTSEMIIELQGNNAGGGGDGGELSELSELSEQLEDSAATTSAAEELAAAALDMQPLLQESAFASELGSAAAELDSGEIADFNSLSTGSLGASVGDGGGEGGGSGQGIGTGVGDGNGPGIGRTSMFNLVGEGQRFVYVFDRSGSMTSVFRMYSEDALVRQISPLELAKAELLQSLEKLAEHHQFQIVFYNHLQELFSTHYQQSQLFPATSENKQLASEFVASIYGEGNTNHWDALQVALELRPDVIFLITDGEAKDDPPLYQVQTLAKFCKRKRIQVNVIHFSNTNRPDCTLIPLAEVTRGKHIFINLQAGAAAN